MDTTPIAARLNVIAKAVHALEELQDISFDEFVEDYFAQSAAERNFQVAIQAALDIGSILLSAAGSDTPQTYSEIFPALAAIGVLPEAFALKIAGMAGFRNVLVHLYLELDVSKLHGYLQNDLNDFTAFAQYVGEYLSSHDLW